MVNSVIHPLVLASLPAATAVVMMRLGTGLRLLHSRRGGRRCAACGRHLPGRRCAHCEP